MVKILIIEDNNAIRELTAELLELEGYSTFTASNGKIGLGQIRLHLPDLILCDIRMPEMDGLTLLQHLGQHPDLKRIPFIFFSSKSEKVDVNRGLDAGADAYLIKPFDMEELLASIGKCLSNKRLSK